MAYTVQKANEYIKTATVNGQYRMNYHMMPPVGWMNDPNGLIKFDGAFHLFYQFYPYESKNGAMHWGHFVSDDLVSYRDVSVALAPDADGEDGCFSGGAEVQDGKIALVYTRHREPTEDIEQSEVCYAAKTDDGLSYTKSPSPIFDNADLPREIDRIDFRDPCPVKIGDKYYVFVGGKTTDNRGVIVVLVGDTLDKLDYDFYIGPLKELGNMAECPSYERVGDKDVLVVSGVHAMEREHDFKTLWISYFIVGDIDFKNKKMTVDSIKEIDKGDAFYAPQFVRYADTPTIIAWAETWGKRYPTREFEHNWVGSFTIPRELSLVGDRVYQNPVRALKQYRKKVDIFGCIPKSADITAKTSGKFTLAISSGDNKVEVGSEDGRIYLDTRYSNNQNGRKRHTRKKYGACNIRLLIDVSSIELFVGDGREAISSRMYLNGDFKFETSGSISDIVVYEIEVKQ